MVKVEMSEYGSISKQRYNKRQSYKNKAYLLLGIVVLFMILKYLSDNNDL
jgi:hypothetical protein